MICWLVVKSVLFVVICHCTAYAMHLCTGCLHTSVGCFHCHLACLFPLPLSLPARLHCTNIGFLYSNGLTDPAVFFSAGVCVGWEDVLAKHTPRRHVATHMQV